MSNFESGHIRHLDCVGDDVKRSQIPLWPWPMVELWLIKGFYFFWSQPYSNSWRKHSHTPVKHREQSQAACTETLDKLLMGRADLSVLGCELLDQLLKGCEFLPINQVKLLKKERQFYILSSQTFIYLW